MNGSQLRTKLEMNGWFELFHENDQHFFMKELTLFFVTYLEDGAPVDRKELDRASKATGIPL